MAELAQLTISQGLLATLISIATGIHHYWVLLTHKLRLQTLGSILPSARGLRHYIVAQNGHRWYTECRTQLLCAVQRISMDSKSRGKSIPAGLDQKATIGLQLL